ncbi:1996_t:CDS:2 [Ambispora gerdemannii]|uniref:1996_t:CDS:1 n=1 Tax=Ambispora gerdemannii TaxID=144530 RepID=A0A9N9GRA7_9GLOM|nr:1996_t:CDS:2 [Ambispora gerdemannii]
MTDQMKKILFPPYINRHVNHDITEVVWEEAFNIWNANLSLLLKLLDNEFANQILENDSLSTFLETFLKTRAGFHELGAAIDKQMMPEVEVALERKVMLVMLRLTQPRILVHSTTEATSLAASLYQSKFLSVPLLLDFLVIYAKSNYTHAQRMFSNAVELVPNLLLDFENFSGVILDHIRSLSQRIESLKISVGSAANNGAVNNDADLRTYFMHIIDVAISLDCLFSISKPVTNIFTNHQGNDENQGILMAINQLYESTIPAISDLLDPENSSKEIMRALNILKHALVSLIYHTFDASYFSPLGFTAEIGNSLVFIASGDEKLTDQEKIKGTLDRMCDILLSLSEQSMLEKPVLSFVDAPLLLDLEIEFNLNFINKSLEMMRNMVQEAPPRQKRSDRIKTHRLLTMTNGELKNVIKSSPAQSNVKVEKSIDDEVKRGSLISQVKDLFPELGEGFIEHCLIALNENPETVVDHLLENNLPDELVKLDRSLPRLPSRSNEKDGTLSNIEAESPLANRRNIFDNDEFDVFAGKQLDSSRTFAPQSNYNLVIVMADIVAVESRGSAQRMLDDKSFVESYKESIIESAYTSLYEDEYDDTYDTSGLQTGAFDIHLLDELEESEAGPSRHNQIDPGVLHESELIKMYQNDPSVFERTNATRKSKKREQLCRITEMTDEQIEGWFIMFQRNPRKNKLLEKYEWKGQQKEINISETEEGSSSLDHQRTSSYESRGRGRGEVPGTSRGRAQKKGRGGNHNRKNAHAKKMGKGFGSFNPDS